VNRLSRTSHIFSRTRRLCVESGKVAPSHKHTQKVTVWVLVLLSIATSVISSSIYLYTPAFTPKVKAAPNNTINFQARLLSNTGAVAPDGYYNVEFKLYDAASGGTLLWTDTRYDTNGGTPGNDYRVQVKNGYLTVSLGDTTAGGTAFPGSIDWSQELWLTMNIGGTTQTASPTWNGEMNPRMKVTAVPYAFAASKLKGSTGMFDADQLAQLGPGSVQTVNSANTALRINQTGAGSLLQFQASGNDRLLLAANGNLTVAGTGVFQGASVSIGTSSQAGVLTLNDGSSNTTTLQAAATSANLTFTLPAAYGSNGECIVGNGSGGLSFSNTCGTGGSGSAPSGATYLTLTNDATLTNERVLTAGTNISVSDTGANGTLTINVANSPTFSGTLTVQGASVTVGTTSQQGSLVLNDGSSNTTTLQSAAIASNLTFKLPSGYGGNGDCIVGDGAGNFSFSSTCGVGGSGSAPIGASYLTLGLDGSLTNERVLTAGTNISISDGGANGNLTVATVNNPSFSTSVTSPLFTGTGAVTIASTGGANALTLNSGSGTIVLGASTLQRTATGTTTINLNDTANTTLAITNSGTGVASLTVEGGATLGANLNITAGGATITGNSTITGTLSSLTGLTSSGTITFSGLNTAGMVTTNASGVLSTGAVDRNSATYFNTALSIANGGTGATTSQAAINALSQLTTEGDLLFRNATNSTRLARGTNGQCLVSNATTILWQACSGAGSGSTLQAAYDAGNTITTTDARDLSVTLANTATDSNFLVNIAASSTSKFAVQNNGTDVLTVTSSGVTFGTTINIGTNNIVTSATTIASTELDRLDGKDAALVDTNDAVNTAITGTGALASGSIASGFGTISTSNTITGTTVNGTTGINTGAGAGTQRIDASGNLVAIGNITGSGAVTLASTGGANALTLNSGSGTIVLGASTLQRTATGTTTINLNDTANTTLAITNSGTGVASLTVEGGATLGANLNITAGGATITGNSTITGTLSSLTGLTSSGTITFSGLNTAGMVTTNASGVLSTGAVDRNAATYFNTALSIANGGTGATTSQAAINALSQLTTNGDLLYNNGTNSTRLARGTNGQCLVSNATTILWQACSGAGSGSTLQAAYDAGNTITTTDARDLSVTLANTTTDSNFLVNIATSSSSKFAVQNNGTDVLTVTSSGVTFGTTINIGTNNIVTSATTIASTELDRLDGKDAALVDTNDAVNTAITGTGALASGSIASGFGTISTSNTITGTTVNGTTGINTGAGAGTQRIDASGNLVAIGNITGSGAVTLASTGGANALTLNSGSGTIVLGASTLQRTATGTTTINLNDTANTTLAITNSGTGVASLTVEGGATLGANLNITAGGATITGNSTITGTLSSLTGLTSSGTITFSGLNTAGMVTTNASGVLSTGAVDRNAATYFNTALSIANGGTGATTSQAAINALSQLTTNGDLLYNNGTNSTRLARGGANTCLISNATTITWGSCATGGSGFTSLTLTGNSGTNQTINEGDSINIRGDGTVLTAVAGATDTVTLSVVADSIGDAQLAFNTGQNLTTTSNVQFANITGTGDLTAQGNTTLGNNASIDRLTVTSQILGTNALSFQGATDNTFTTTFAISDPTVNQTITFPNATGTVCLTSGNCAGVGGTGDILQGGNSFGAAVTIGANDSFGINLETAGITRFSIDNLGAGLMNGPLSVAGTFTVNTDKLVVNTTSGNTAIGSTDTSTYKLNVVGGSNRFNNGNQTLTFLTGTNTSGYAADLSVNDDGVNLSNNSASRGYNFKNSAGTLLSLSAAGNATVLGNLNTTGQTVTVGSSGCAYLNFNSATNSINYCSNSMEFNTTQPLGYAFTDSEVRVGSGGTVDTASADGDLYVQDFLEVDGSASLAGTLTLGTDVTLSRGAANRLDIATGDNLNIVNGNLQVAGTTRLTSAGLFQAADGAVGGPAYAFSGDLTTGMYRIGASQIGFSAGGTERLRVDTSGARVNGVLAQTDTTGNYRYRNVTSYQNNVDNLDGALVINVPDGFNTMMNISIKGYNYASANGAWELILGGYVYNDGNTWINTSAEIRGKAPFNRVRFMQEGGAPRIVLGNDTDLDNWKYPQVSIDVDIAGYSGQANYLTGWGAALSTDVSTFTTPVEPALRQTVYSNETFLQNGNSFGTIATIGTNDNNNLDFETNGTTRWSITTAGILQSNGAQTIQSSTGNLTLATGGGNGNIVVNANGTGILDVQDNATFAGTVRVNGTGITNSSGYEIVQTNATDWLRINQNNSFTNGTAAYGNWAFGTGGLSVGTWGTAGAGNIQASGNIAAGGTLTVTGNSTFDTNTLFVNSSTNSVGIGTASPSKQLTITSPTNDVEVLRINAYGGAGGVVGQAEIGFGFYDTNGEASASLGFEEYSSASAGGNLIFKTRPDGATEATRPTERWRITSTGILQSSGAQTIQTSTGNLTLATGAGNGNILLTPNGTGNVGIGTASPVQELHVKSGSNNGDIRLESSTGEYLDYFAGTTGVGYSGIWAYGANNHLSLGTNGSEKLRITTGGNVGIGTNNPATKLHVSGGDINVDSGYGIRINQAAPSGQYLRGDGTRFVSSAIQATDLPSSVYNYGQVAGNHDVGYYIGNGWYKIAETSLTSNCQSPKLWGDYQDLGYTTAARYSFNVSARVECDFTTNNESHHIDWNYQINSTYTSNIDSKFRIVRTTTSTNLARYELQVYVDTWDSGAWQFKTEGGSWTLYSTPQTAGTPLANPRVNKLANLNVYDGAIAANQMSLGTTTVDHKLEVNGRAKASSWSVYSTSGDVTNSSPWYGLGWSNLTLPNASANAVQLGGYYGINFATAAGSSTMVLNQQGRLGLGTNNPDAQLQISGSSNSLYNLHIYNGGGSATGVLINGGAGGNGATLLRIANSADTVPYFTVRDGNSYFENGNVGIGSSSPVGKLYVGDAAGAKLSIGTNTSAGSTASPLLPALDFLGYQNGNRARIQSTEETSNTYGSKFSILVNDGSSASSLVERFTILQGGNVGIGTNNPSQKLEVTGNVLSSGTLQGTRLISTVSTGISPFAVSSTTVVANLNSDLLDGQDGSYYQNATNINNGTLSASNGGTGLSSYTTGDLLYASGATTISKLAAVASGSCLISNGVGAAPSWGSCGTGFVQLAPASAQTDSSANSSIFINKTGASGNLLTLQKGASNVLTVGNTGATTLKNTADSTTAFQIQNAAGTSIVNVDTTNQQLIVRNKTDISSVGSDIFGADNNTCSGTGWTDIGTNVWSHTPGTAQSLVCTSPASVTAGVTYEITYSDTLGGAGTPAIYMGGGNAALQQNVTNAKAYITTTNTSGISMTASLAHSGSLTIHSVKIINFNTSAFALKSSDGTVNLEIRTGYGGANNIGIGLNALRSTGYSIKNIAIGNNTGANLSSGNSNIFIGHSIDAQSSTGSNQLSIGNLIFGGGGFGEGLTVGTGRIGIGGVQDGTDKLRVYGDIKVGTSGTNGCVKRFDGTALTGTCASDERFKQDVGDMNGILDKVASLQAVTYRFNQLGKDYSGATGSEIQYGLIAQQVMQVAPELVVTDENGYLKVRYELLPIYAIAAIGEQQTQISDAEDRLTALENSIQPASNNILDLTNGGTIQGNLNVVGNLNVTGPVTMSSLTVTDDVVIAGNLTVENITVANITINGHIITAGNTPTATIGTGAGTADLPNNIPAPQVTIEGNDTSGTITIVAGANTVDGELAKVTFTNPFGAKPRIVFSPANRDSAKLGAYYDSSLTTNNSFSIMADQAPQAGKTYTFTYFIVE
jgi:fibronectin-binding autotransporter adhesin